MISRAIHCRLVVLAVTLALFWAAVVVGQNTFGAPKTLVHIVTIQWKPDATDADKQKALDGVKEMAAAIPGIKNVWIKATKVQPADFNAVFVIEFENPEALKRYADHPAHEKWQEHYSAVRASSYNSVVSN